MIDYKDFIERSFSIVDKTGSSVPFRLNKVQDRLLSALSGKDIILKARQVGASSLVLAIFCVDFLLKENSRSVVISHEKSATSKLLERAKYFLKSLEEKNVEIPLKYNSKYELHNEAKNSSLYIGTAGSRALLRGETVNNIHFSEPAYYGTEAENIILGALQSLVPEGRAILESTAQGQGNCFHQEWLRAINGESNFKAHFFGWQDFYSQEFIRKKSKEFADQDLLKQEYPPTWQDAFIASGRPFFNMEAILKLKESVKEPTRTGYLIAGQSPVIDENPKGWWRIWQESVEGESYLISADIGEKSDYSAAGVWRLGTNELVAVMHGHIEAGELAKNLASAGLWYNQALIVPEKNGLGMGVLTALLGLSYPRIYVRRSFDKIRQLETTEYGWLTTSSTRPMALAELQKLVSEQGLKIYDERVLDELASFQRNEQTGKPQAAPGCKDDLVMMAAIFSAVRHEENEDWQKRAETALAEFPDTSWITDKKTGFY